MYAGPTRCCETPRAQPAVARLGLEQHGAVILAAAGLLGAGVERESGAQRRQRQRQLIGKLGGETQILEDRAHAAGVDPAALDSLVHGTTLTTNAVLEHRGALTGMVTTEGMRDVVHIGRHQRPQPYSVMQDIPWQANAFVQRRHRVPVSERTGPPHGETIVALEEDAVRDAARQLGAAGVESIAVCFLFSYLDPRHEQRAAQILREELPDCFITTSAGVSPQFREFERFRPPA